MKSYANTTLTTHLRTQISKSSAKLQRSKLVMSSMTWHWTCATKKSKRRLSMVLNHQPLKLPSSRMLNAAMRTLMLHVSCHGMVLIAWEGQVLNFSSHVVMLHGLILRLTHSSQHVLNLLIIHTSSKKILATTKIMTNVLLTGATLIRKSTLRGVLQDQVKFAAMKPARMRIYRRPAQSHLQCLTLGMIKLRHAQRPRHRHRMALIFQTLLW